MGRARRAAPPAGVATLAGVLLAALVAAARADGAPTPAAATTMAADGAGFAIARHVIAAGGSSSGSGFAVSGTIGQLDADPLQPATGGAFAITGGFWPGAVLPAGDGLFADGFENPSP